MTRYSRDPILIPMKLDGEWAVGLLGGILGLFSMQLPWAVASIPALGGGNIGITISAIDFLGLFSNRIPGTNQAVSSSGESWLGLMLIGIAIFAMACFFTMLDSRMSILMLAGNGLAWAGILGLARQTSSISLSFGYGIVIGLLAGVLSFVGPMVLDYYGDRERSDSEDVERPKLTLDDVRWIRSRIRGMDDVEASAKKLRAAYDAGEIPREEYLKESEIIGITVPPDESGQT